MEATTFVVAGPQAHFRKFYGTNTALSYYLPPRTTVMGLLAARCGWPKGSYHARLHRSRLRIGVGAEVALKKTFHRVNNLKIETGSHFRGSEGRQQIPLELVSGLRFGRDEVRYRIWLAPASEEGREDYEAIVAALRHPGAGAFACCLGAAFCPAGIRDVETLAVEPLPGGERVELSTAVASAAIRSFWRKPNGEPDFVRGLGDGVQLEEEVLVSDFEGDDTRSAEAVIQSICPTGHARPTVTLADEQPAYRVTLGGGATYDFTFLEPFPNV